ncbi:MULTISPECIES: anthranilate synthase family protein [Vibrio]|uniref:anthranilate synthase n=1 Tax=Vibrio bivalvicida TaxID=1276888 RepID=A0A177XU53_9VIBR|nr:MULTISPECIES: anthranilate synthase family protein [Vibrio]KLN67065.1 hypothetical protein ZX61_01000 [Vibrio sp. VPAP30]OAJ92140.1 hypothetical protein APB76_20920 [Vibrio bivalvicida]
MEVCASTHAFNRILKESSQPFAIIQRSENSKDGHIDIITGKISELEVLSDIDQTINSSVLYSQLVLVPYRQIREKGFEYVDDKTPLLSLSIQNHHTMTSSTFLSLAPDLDIALVNEHFDIEDHEYQNIVTRIIEDEIGMGAGANFVLKRHFQCQINNFDRNLALSLYRKLIENESGSYWTYIVFTGERYLIGATPERHVTLNNQSAAMNPISGTYRYPSLGPDRHSFEQFLDNGKEKDELFMVVDEELKMMSSICEHGGTVLGPLIKSMSKVAHTEYLIHGQCHLSPSEVLKQTLFAPTITGSPLENACRVIRKYEPEGRGYYSGIIALVGNDASGLATMDSAILIRSADISLQGELKIAVGSTLVRHSNPKEESEESRAKAQGFLSAIKKQTKGRHTEDFHSFFEHTTLQEKLTARNTLISPFWLTHAERRQSSHPNTSQYRVLILDAEDTFTDMIAHQFRALNCQVTVKSCEDKYDTDDYDLTVLGPGPGNPADFTDLRVTALNRTLNHLLEHQKPFIAVCLSHQILSMNLGFQVKRKEQPNQGVQKQIDLFGSAENVGFYNSFSAYVPEDHSNRYFCKGIRFSYDFDSLEVHALRGEHFASFQFHPESLLTQRGMEIWQGSLKRLLGDNNTIITHNAVA